MTLCIQADQRACEWRSGFASTALAILQVYFDDNDYDTDEACQDFANFALDNWSFLYCDVTMQGDDVSSPPDLVANYRDLVCISGQTQGCFRWTARHSNLCIALQLHPWCRLHTEPWEYIPTSYCARVVCSCGERFNILPIFCTINLCKSSG
jgi:hypothetical protein